MENYQIIPEQIKEDIINLLDNKIAADEAKRLLLWLKHNEENKKFFDEITNIWHKSSSLSKTDEFDSNEAWNDISKQLRRASKQESKNIIVNWFKPLSKVAAVIIIVVLSAMIIRQNLKDKAESGQFVEMVAPMGSRSILTLPDGTKVWLNSGSKISFSNSFGKTTRYLRLDGEAYFVVAKNKKIPFVVHTSELNVTALGTVFNVKAYADEKTVETTLVEGSVKIEPTIKDRKSSTTLVLKPNQKAVYRKIEIGIDNEKNIVKAQDNQKDEKYTSLVPIALKVDTVVDTKPYTSWKDNRWLFRREKLDNLIRKLERRYDVEITFKDDALKNYTFSGSLYDESIEQVFNAIKLIAPIDYKIEHRKIEITINNDLNRKYENLKK